MSNYEEEELSQADIERLLAEQIGGYNPAQRGNTSEQIGGDTVNWHTLPDQDAAAVWEALREWVEWFTLRYNIPISTVPDCWYQHGHLVEELSALHTAHIAAFDPTDTGYGPIGWHERLTLALPRLTRAYGGGCNNGHRTTKPRTWHTGQDEWTAWTNQAHAHPSTPGAPQPQEEQ